jgi:hypothetical protein
MLLLALSAGTSTKLSCSLRNSFTTSVFLKYIIRHIALDLAREDFEIIPAASLEETIDYGDEDMKQLFVFDDALGVHDFDITQYNKLMRMSGRIFDLLAKESKLLFSCRSEVFRKSKSLKSLVTD